MNRKHQRLRKNRENMTTASIKKTAVKLDNMGYELASKDLERVKKEFRKYLCVLCLLVLQDPIQTPCAHLYCRSCFESLILDKRKTKFRCQEDGAVFDTSKAFPDGCVKRELLHLKIHCPNCDSDCPWEGELKSLEAHLKTCEYATVPCVHSECSKIITKAHLAEHLEKECTQRIVNCGYCHTETKFALLVEHEKNCPSLPVACNLCGAKDIKQSLLSQHQDPNIGKCEKSKSVICPFLALGCPETKVMELSERRRHEQSLLAFHVNLLLKHFLSLKEQLEITLGNSELLETIKTNISELVSKVTFITHTDVNTQQQIKGINARVGMLEENLGACGGSKVCSDMMFLKHQFQDQANQLQECDRKLVNIEAKTQNYEFLLGEATRTIEEQRQENLHLMRKLEETSQEVRRLSVERGYQRDQSVARPTIISWDQMPSTDGTLMWKITNYTQRRQEAITGRNTSFYSPTFYTSRHGYKMCARIYLNGDGMGRESHISLFFVLMRGEYDGLLRWPFKQKITMMILDQDNVEHAIDAFRPDPNSSSFQRPRREMNIASGCPLFCPLSEMDKHAYVRDDVMFVKIIVDRSDMVD